MNWSDIKYDLADFFFGSAMDRAYSQGVRAGAEYAARKISFAVYQSGEGLTKTQEIGRKHAYEVIQAEKKEIAKNTGAML